MTQSTPRESSPHVLIADDDRFFCDSMRDVLASASVACEVAASAASALQAVDDPRIGVVVLELGLDDAGGLETLKALRARRPALRVIVLAVHTDQERVLEALRMGACDYLAKPLHDEELVLAVERAQRGFANEWGLEVLRRRLALLERWVAELAARAADAPPDQRLRILAQPAVHALAEVLGASKTSLLVPDAEGVELRVVAAVGCDFPVDKMDSVMPDEGVAGSVFSGGEPIVVGDVQSDARFVGRVARARYLTGSFAAAPVSGGGPVRGVLCATDRPGGLPFDADDALVLRLFSHHLGQLLAGGAPRHALPAAAAPDPGATASAAAPLAVSAASADSRDDAEMARQICEALTTEIEPERIIAGVLRPVAAMLPASPVSLYLLDARSGNLAIEGTCEPDGRADRPVLPRNAGLTGTVLQTGRLVATDHPETDPRFDPAVDTPEGGAVGPLLCVPLCVRGKVLGVLRAFPRPGAGASTPKGGRASAASGEVLAAALSAAVRSVLLYRSLLESIDDVARARRETQERRSS